MKYTQKTADDLRKEINLLSVSQNQHQAAVEEEQKKLKAVKKEIKDAEVICETSVAAKDKAVKSSKKAQEKLQGVLDEVAREETKLSEASMSLGIAKNDVTALEKKSGKLKEVMIEECESMDIKKELYKKEVSDLCDKIKAGL